MDIHIYRGIESTAPTFTRDHDDCDISLYLLLMPVLLFMFLFAIMIFMITTAMIIIASSITIILTTSKIGCPGLLGAGTEAVQPRGGEAQFDRHPDLHRKAPDCRQRGSE